jgi:hypothetical protein
MIRHMAIGGNWNVLRMGVIFAMNEFQSQSYNRIGGFMWGASSGSRTPFSGVSDTTAVGMLMGAFYSGYLFYGDVYGIYTYQQDATGSFFYSNGYAARGWVTGSVAPGGGQSGGNFWMPNIGQATPKRGIMLLQISASGGQWKLTHAGPLSSSLITQGANKDYVEGDLIAALTGSGQAFPTTASGVLLGSVTDTAQISTTVPLDTVYFVWTGVPSIEIYDWYIYKVA